MFVGACMFSCAASQEKQQKRLGFKNVQVSVVVDAYINLSYFFASKQSTV
jgi:hypothetical protein